MTDKPGQYAQTRYAEPPIKIMPKQHDTLFRHWRMLRMIPRYPHKISIQAIRGQLADEGFQITERTLQRDLNELSSVFPLTVDDREKPYGWSWDREAKSFDLPCLTSTEALMLVLAERHLGQIMPGSTIEALRPYFKSARERLNSESSPHPTRSWLDKIRSIPATQPLIPPQVDAEVHRVVTDALLKERQLDIAYRKKGQQQAENYTIHPLALIQHGSILYLYARLFDYPNAITLAMHRAERAAMRDQAVIPPPDFDLDNKVARGVWEFGGGETIALKIRFYDGAGEHLRETPLSTAQQIEPLPNYPETLDVAATVANTLQLKWWLLGFGERAEVLAPESLRHSLSETAAKMYARYDKVP